MRVASVASSNAAALTMATTTRGKCVELEACVTGGVIPTKL